MATIGKSIVKSQKEAVGEATFPIYDSVIEATEAEGEAVILDLVNSQIRTNACNTLRAAKTGKPTKEKIQNDAFARLTPEEFASCVGDQAKLQKIIAKYVAEVKAEYGMEKPGESAEGDDDEGDDE